MGRKLIILGWMFIAIGIALVSFDIKPGAALIVIGFICFKFVPNDVLFPKD